MAKAQPAKSTAKPQKSAPVKEAKKPEAKAKPAPAAARPEKGGKPTNGKRTNSDGGNAHAAAKETYFIANDGKKEAAEDAKLTPFLRKQKERLIHLRDNMVDSMTGVAKDTL